MNNCLRHGRKFKLVQLVLIVTHNVRKRLYQVYFYALYTLSWLLTKIILQSVDFKIMFAHNIHFNQNGRTGVVKRNPWCLNIVTVIFLRTTEETVRNKLLQLSTVNPEKVIVSQLFKNVTYFEETEGSLSCS